MVREHLPDTLE